MLVPKVTGADIELANFFTEVPDGLPAAVTSSHRASVSLLEQMEGVSETTLLESVQQDLFHRLKPDHITHDARDWGRRWLSSNGGCCYIDLSHLEICLPETQSCLEHLAAWQAMLRITRRAWQRANQNGMENGRIEVLVNNSDGFGNSYGGHVNLLLSRRAWENLFHRKLHFLLYLATFQVSSIILTGQGKVGSENGRAPVPFQISQRADFFEVLTGPQTTYRRPIVNSRDESHTAGGGRARYHCIFYDSTLCHGSTLLKVGLLQLVLALIESEQLEWDLILEDPVEALIAFSHDPTLKARARLASGGSRTALELQYEFLSQVSHFAERVELDDVVPGWREILALWESTLDQLQQGNFAELAARLDWVLKMLILDRVIADTPALSWESDPIKSLDHLYSSIDPDRGLYWVYEQAGQLERYVPNDQIEALVHNPPAGTRAWARAHLLRRFGPYRFATVDWDRLRVYSRPLESPLVSELQMGDPLGFSRAACGAVFESAGSPEEILRVLNGPAKKRRNDHVGKNVFTN